MNDVNQQIRSRIEGFVSEIAELVRQATLDSVYATLGAVESRARGPQRGAARGAGAQVFAGGAGRRGGKRSPKELESMSGEIMSYVRQNPGQGVEQISVALGISSRELTLPIRKLVGQGELVTEGQKRATKYFLGGSRQSAARSQKGQAQAGKAGRRGGRAPAKRGRGRSSARG